jgi:hypothetical protein
MSPESSLRPTWPESCGVGVGAACATEDRVAVSAKVPRSDWAETAELDDFVVEILFNNWKSIDSNGSDNRQAHPGVKSRGNREPGQGYFFATILS